MKIGIVNAGNIGLNLATAWIRHGHDIMLSKDTHPEKLQERVRVFGLDHGLSETEVSRFKYGSLANAAKFGDVVVLSLYFPRLSHVLKDLKSAGVTLSGKIVVDTMNPAMVDANFNHSLDLEYMERTSTTEDIQKAFPEAVVFKAFNTMTSTVLDVREWTSGRVPPHIFVGGDPSSTTTVRKLIQDTGFRPLFAGYDLKTARVLERLSILFHHLTEDEFQGDFNIAFDIIRLK
ncbi:coenzyme F420-dependent NADP oxidoreductase [Xylaria arbuscula]|nr:coenzyme F420-dependent NADP oxidoreductase [Xylaria arbuscula]